MKDCRRTSTGFCRQIFAFVKRDEWNPLALGRGKVFVAVGEPDQVTREYHLPLRQRPQRVAGSILGVHSYRVVSVFDETGSGRGV